MCKKAPPLALHHLQQTGSRVGFLHCWLKRHTRTLKGSMAFIFIPEGREVYDTGTLILPLSPAAVWKKPQITVKVTEGTCYSRKRNKSDWLPVSAFHLVKFLLQSRRKCLSVQRRISPVQSAMTSLKILLFCRVATASVTTVCTNGGERNKYTSVRFVRKCLYWVIPLVTWR